MPNHRTSLLLSSILLTACFPMSWTYEHIDAPDTKYFKSICRGTIGPRSTVYFPFHGIYISVDFSYASFGLHIPEGMTVLLNDDTIEVDGVSKFGPLQKSVHTKVFRRGAADTNDPPEFGVKAPYTSPDELGPFEGRSVGNHYVYYSFLGVDETHPNQVVSLPTDLQDGTIELPAMTINGQRYERQRLPFKQAKFSAISPVNC